jgi:hypothetical protein
MLNLVIIIATYVIVAVASAFIGAEINDYINEKQCRECADEWAYMNRKEVKF